LNESRIRSTQSQIDKLNERQGEIQQLSTSNLGKQNIYEDRQGSLAANAMLGQQGRIGRGGKYKRRKSRKHIKSRKHRRH
jgi:hypothetical protein